MSEPIAVNSYTLTKDLFHEGMKCVSKENYGKFAKKVVLVVLAAWLVMAVLTVVLGQGYSLLLGESVVTAFVIVWVTVYLPWDKRRRGWKRMEEQYGADMERTTEFYADSFTVHAAGREITVPYAEVEEQLEGERLRVLLTENGTGIMLKKDSFTSGSWDEVLLLLKNIK